MLHSKPRSQRLISLAIAVVFVFVSMLAGTESVSAATKLKVSAAKKTIYVGQTVKLKANKKVKWSVTKKKVAKLTKIKKKTVTVKGLKPGTVYVKAKAGKKTKKIKITVKAKPKAAAKKPLRIVSSNDLIGIGETCYVTTIENAGYVTLDEVTFTSSDSSVADVYYTGLVTGISPGTATITATYKKDKSVKASVNIQVVDTKAGTMTVTIDMTDPEKYPAGKPVKAWFQVPVTDNNQVISKPVHKAAETSGTVREEIIKDSSGATVYYLEWGADVAPEERTATLSYHVYRRAVSHSKDLSSKESGTVTDAIAKDPALEEYLKPTTWGGSLTEGVVKQTADEIVSDEESVYNKAHAIYLWICENITRDKSLANRELGDVQAILLKERDAGSCIDINSVFVALCNAKGIPARESFGYKIYSSPKDSPSKLGQNCRAEFYLPGYGWVEVDPAMPLGKIMYNEDEYRGEGAPKAGEWENLKETYWTSGSADWFCQNHGRDVTFPDGPLTAAPGYMVNEDGSLNHFMFPVGEYDGQLVPGWGAVEGHHEDFQYTYSYKYENPLDCGC